MGMFDTIRFPQAVPCPHCGAAISDTQTRNFGNVLKTYQVGDVVDSSDVKTGVVEEDLFCPQCQKSGQHIYVTLWHSMVSGVHTSLAAAEEKLLNVDRAELLNHLIRHQTQRDDLVRRYLELYHTVEGYRDHLRTRDSAGTKSSRGPVYVSTRLPEFLEDAAPLDRILEAYSPDTTLEEYVSEA